MRLRPAGRATSAETGRTRSRTWIFNLADLPGSWIAKAHEDIPGLGPLVSPLTGDQRRLIGLGFLGVGERDARDVDRPVGLVDRIPDPTVTSDLVLPLGKLATIYGGGPEWTFELVRPIGIR